VNSVWSVAVCMSVWRITGRIIRTTIMLITYAAYNGVLTILGLACFFFYFVFCVFVKVKLTVPLLCVCVQGKAVPEMTYTVLGGTLNPTHSLTLSPVYDSIFAVDAVSWRPAVHALQFVKLIDLLFIDSSVKWSTDWLTHVFRVAGYDSGLAGNTVSWWPAYSLWSGAGSHETKVQSAV